MSKEFELFIGSDRVEIMATSSGAKAYACGLLEGFRLLGRNTGVQVYEIETGKLIFSR